MSTLAARPLQHLSAYSRRYPQAWRQLEAMHLDRGKGLPEWPTWCFMPLAGAFAVVSNSDHTLTPFEVSRDVAIVGALGAWRITKGIYTLDETLMDALWRTPITGDIPSAVLEHLPEWCVYIMTEGREVMGQPLRGYFCHLEHDANDKRRELRLLLDYDTGLAATPIHLGGTLLHGLEQMVYEAEIQAALLGHDVMALRSQLSGDVTDNQRWASQLTPLVSVAIYLCSEAPDVEGRVPGVGMHYPTAKRTKKGMRLFAAPGPRLWRVGAKLGDTIRRARLEANDQPKAPDKTRQGDRAGVSPHLRRAHWHLFWRGPRDGERTPVVKWLPPIPVGFEQF